MPITSDQDDWVNSDDSLEESARKATEVGEKAISVYQESIDGNWRRRIDSTGIVDGILTTSSLIGNIGSHDVYMEEANVQ